MASFDTRESRLVRVAKLIEDTYKEGDWFTVHDIANKGKIAWRSCPTLRELSKIIPALPLHSEKRPKHNYNFYRYDGQKPLYVRRTRP